MESTDGGFTREKGWAFLLGFLLALLIVGGVLLFLQFREGRPPLEITFSPPTSPGRIEVSLSGAVDREGIYSLSEDSQLQEVLQRAGGVTSDADSSTIEVRVPYKEETSQPQKIDINRAEAWLLEALPGIGEERAQSIIRYRTEVGPFHSIEDLRRVPGIGEATFQQVKDLITVAD